MFEPKEAMARPSPSGEIRTTSSVTGMVVSSRKCAVAGGAVCATPVRLVARTRRSWSPSGSRFSEGRALHGTNVSPASSAQRKLAPARSAARWATAPRAARRERRVDARDRRAAVVAGVAVRADRGRVQRAVVQRDLVDAADPVW